MPAGGVPGLPLPVVLVDEGLLLAMRERLRAMAAAVTAAQKEAQYQVCLYGQWALRCCYAICNACVQHRPLHSATELKSRAPPALGVFCPAGHVALSVMPMRHVCRRRCCARLRR